MQGVFNQLMSVILDRKANPRANSYTNALLDAGMERIAAKVIEEAGETVEAAAEPGADGQAHLVREVSDLFYHVLVLLAFRDLTLTEVEQELSRRFGISGLDEKASRSAQGKGSSS